MAAYDYNAWQQQRDQVLEERMHQMFDQIWWTDAVYSPRQTSREEQQRIYEGYLPFWREAMGQTHLHPDFPTYMSEEMIRPKGYAVFCARQCRYAPTVLHEHEFFEFDFQIGGNCTQYVHDRQLLLQEGEVLLIPPGTRHQPAMLDESCTLYSVGISRSRMPLILAHLWQEEHPLLAYLRERCETPSQGAHVLLRPAPGIARRILRPLVESPLAEPGPLGRRLAEILVEQVVAALLPWSDGAVYTADDPHEHPMLRYINSHFKTVTRRELAEYFSYSERRSPAFSIRRRA